MFARILMNTKSIQMTRLNDLCQRGTRKYLKPNRKSRQSREISSVKTNAVRKKVIAFSATYCPTLTKYQRIINKHWHILNINDIFENQRQIIGGSTIRRNKKLLKVKQNANMQSMYYITMSFMPTNTFNHNIWKHPSKRTI